MKVRYTDSFVLFDVVSCNKSQMIVSAKLQVWHKDFRRTVHE